MKNITLSPQFFTDILQLDAQSQLYVLTTCQQLAAGDEATIEQFAIPANAPDVLIQFVKRLKRRVRTSQRRRERLKAKAAQAHKTATVPITERVDSWIPPLPASEQRSPIIDQALRSLSDEMNKVKNLHEHFSYNVVNHIRILCFELIRFADSTYNKRQSFA